MKFNWTKKRLFKTERKAERLKNTGGGGNYAEATKGRRFKMFTVNKMYMNVRNP